jgi:hypothetical protein
VGGSKTAPRIFIFSIAMGADYSFCVKTIEAHACTFLTLIILAIATLGGSCTPISDGPGVELVLSLSELTPIQTRW